jgi:hypothetical protein
VKELLKETSSSAGVAGNPDFPSARQFTWIAGLLLTYFGLRLLLFSIAIYPDVPPDEVTHVGVIRVFSHVFFLPQNSPGTYELGLVTNIPWLYYWIMGKLLALNIFGMPDLLFLRLMNIPIAFGTLYFAWRMLRLLTDDRLTQVLLIVAMTNTLMFTFLSSFVTYDNLTNLFAAMAMYCLLAFFKNRSGDLLAASFLCQMAGSLTKISFLPLILILTILLLVHEFKNLRLLPGALPAWFKTAGWRRWGLALAILFGLALNIQLYGGNYYHYGSPNPDLSEVVSPEAGMQNRLAARDMIFDQFKEGRISGQEAMDRASQIKNPGDRKDTIFLMENYFALKNNMIKMMGPLEYSALWAWYMSGGIFSIPVNYHLFTQGPTLWPFAALGVLTGLGILARWRPSDLAWLPACMMVIVAFYGLFLLWFVNYPKYLYLGEFSSGVQGRYLFPVLGALYAVSSYYLLRLFRNGRLRLALSAAACIIFIAFDLPFFLINVTPDWFAPLSH